MAQKIPHTIKYIQTAQEIEDEIDGVDRSAPPEDTGEVTAAQVMADVAIEAEYDDDSD